MPRFPYMNFPFPFYKTPPKVPTSFHNTPEPEINHNNVNFNSVTSLQNNNYIPKTEANNLHEENISKKNKSNNNVGDYLFDLFGLKIYSDDVLLVSLIYFLYSEGVKDDGLFLVLILLLLN